MSSENLCALQQLALTLSCNEYNYVTLSWGRAVALVYLSCNDFYYLLRPPIPLKLVYLHLFVRFRVNLHIYEVYGHLDEQKPA